MPGRLEELRQRIEQIAGDSSDLDCLYARAIAGLLSCAPYVDAPKRKEALAKAQDGIDRLVQRLGEDDQRVEILQEMYGLAADEAP